MFTALAGLGLAATADAAPTGGDAPAGRIAFPPEVIPPPMSVRTAQDLAAHPDRMVRLVASLPRRAEASAPTPGANRASAGSGAWQLIRPAPSNGLCNPLLLTDGTVMVHVCNSPKWLKLTPDAKGDYARGRWSTIAPLPVIGGTQYAPQYNASAVLPDGRVVVVGGEYNGSGTGVWTNLGAIYDPTRDRWTPLAPPLGSGWNQIGDAASVVLADGRFLLAACCSFPAKDALLDARTLTWTPAGAPKAGDHYQDEQGYTLTPYGTVITLDIWTHFSTGQDANNAERYLPTANRWYQAGTTPVSLVDPISCGNFEIGPAITRGDGRIIAFGGNTGCVGGATADPTAIYVEPRNIWMAGPNVPGGCGQDGSLSCDLADAPAALEPSGTILFAASSNYGGHPTHFFEYSGRNVITPAPDPLLNAANSGAYYYNLLVLPNGQIFMTDFSRDAEVYTPAGRPLAAWGPTIGAVSTGLTRGVAYSLSGSQLNGRSQGAAYGDDVQAETNYPIVKVVNWKTGHVAYGRTFAIGQMSIAPGASGTTRFSLPMTAETGPSSLYVVANGIASPPVAVTVQ